MKHLSKCVSEFSNFLEILSNLYQRSTIVALLIVLSGCSEILLNTTEQRVPLRKYIQFQGTSVDDSGITTVHFQLENKTNRLLCLNEIDNSNHYGRISYFTENGVNYHDRIGFSHFWPNLDTPFDKISLLPQDAALLFQIPTSGTIDIERKIVSAIHTSYAGVDMTQGTEFNGAFSGKIDLYAELEITMVDCGISDPSERYLSAPFVFISGRVGPFRIVN